MALVSRWVIKAGYQNAPDAVERLELLLDRAGGNLYTTEV